MLLFVNFLRKASRKQTKRVNSSETVENKNIVKQSKKDKVKQMHQTQER